MADIPTEGCIHEGTFADDRGPDETQRCIHCGVDVPNREL